jgi:hypothetical protein
MLINISAYFGLRKKISINLAGDFWQSDQEVSEEQNLMLDANFTKQEVKDAVFGSYTQGAPRPDGFFLYLLSTFLGACERDLMLLVN